MARNAKENNHGTSFGWKPNLVIHQLSTQRMVIPHNNAHSPDNTMFIMYLIYVLFSVPVQVTPVRAVLARQPRLLTALVARWCQPTVILTVQVRSHTCADACMCVVVTLSDCVRVFVFVWSRGWERGWEPSHQPSCGPIAIIVW